MELTLSQFAAWSEHLNAGQLQVLIAIHLSKSLNTKRISEITNSSQRNARRIIKELNALGLISHLQEEPERPDLSAVEGTNSDIGDKSGQVEDKFGHERPDLSAVEGTNSDIGDKSGQVEDKTGHERPNLSLQKTENIPLKPDEPKENKAENQSKIAGNLTPQVIQAALPNLNLKNTYTKELNIDLIPEDPIYTHAHALPVAGVCACAPVSEFQEAAKEKAEEKAMRVCAPVGEDVEAAKEPPTPTTITVSATTVTESPTTHPQKQDALAVQKSPDSGQFGAASMVATASGTNAFPDYYRKFEQRFQRNLPVWRDENGVKEGFIEFIRKTLDKMGGEHSRADAVIYIDRREKAMEFVSLEARAQDWLNEEKQRMDKELERQKRASEITFDADNKPVDLGTVQAQIDVLLIQLRWTKVEAMEFMLKTKKWPENIVTRNKRFDRLTDEDLISLLIALKEHISNG